MSSKYIYAGTRSTVLKNTLLTNDQLEVLLGAEDFERAYQALHETFLAPYIARKTSHQLSAALEEVVTDTKELLQKIAPDPEILDILWLKYDFYNLRTIIKGDILDWSDEDIERLCFAAGKFDPRTLIVKYRDQRLKFLNPDLHLAAKKAEERREVSDIDLAVNLGYLRSAKALSDRKKDRFVDHYVKLLIDIFNIQANLRALTYGQPDEAPKPTFVKAVG